MKQRIICKGLAVAIIILFIGVGIQPAIADIVKEPYKPLSKGNILYVGGTGEGNYTKIQDAINNASDGDTVFVYDDSSPYIEQLSIYNAINLIGENKYTTIIDGQFKGNTVYIHGDGCLISGFTIRFCKSSGNEFDYAVLKITLSNSVIIRNNIIKIGKIDYNDWTSAIELFKSTQCIIQNNIIYEDDYEGRTLGVLLHDGSSYTIVSGNDISNYTAGIAVWNLTLGNNYNVISENHIHHCNAGIDMAWDNYNKILNNIIEYNSRNGIYFDYSNFNEISENIISNNGKGYEFYCGIMLTSFSNNNYISYNIISNNNPTGIFIIYGYENTITRNNFIDNWGKSGTKERWWGGAYFCNRIEQWKLLRLNHWKKNYWSDHYGIFPKAIHGDYEIIVFLIPWIGFDWRPAFKPYDIEA
jgi:parallel beta-helix repeat protein